MRVTHVSLGVVLAATLTAGAGRIVSAQSPQNPQTPTFKSTTSLVLVDVTVLDKNGRPVPNLTADDFQVKLDGESRQVRAVTYEQIENPVPVAEYEPPAPAAGAPTRVTGGVGAPAPKPRHRFIVLFIDDLSLSPARGKSMLYGATRFVQNLPPGDVVGLATSSGSVVVQPTTDHLSVQVALPRIVGVLDDPRDLPGLPIGLEEAMLIADNDNRTLDQVIQRDCDLAALVPPPVGAQAIEATLCGEDVARKGREEGRLVEGNAHRQIQAYVDAVNSLKRAPGIKELVAISDGITFVQRDQSAEALVPLAKAAAAAGVQVSVLSEEALGVDLGMSSHDIASGPKSPASPGALNGQVAAQVFRSDTIFLQQGAETVADLTGGTYYRVIGTPDAFFNQVALASSGIYQLGVEAPAKNEPGRDYTLAVKVAKPGLTTHANRHAVMPAPTAPVPVETQLKDAVSNGTPLYGIPISLGAAVRRGDDPSHVNVNVDLDVPASTPGPVTLIFGFADAIGIVQSGKKTLDPPANGGDYRASLTIPVPAGNYSMRLAVADANGETGSVQTRVKAILSPMGPFAASDLLTGYSAPGAEAQFLALEQLPAKATRLYGVLELYPSAGATVPPDLKVHVTISTPDDTQIDDRDVTPQLDKGILRAEAPFDVENMPAGAYVLKATVTAGGATLGTAQTTVQLTKSGGNGSRR